ncbi:hypothetical protein C0030_003590 [Candidatus Liberibacter solanacearum]|uniref:Uncharacterized protein n=1 Tax=Candidatus Liberibacter solanacearum TaxID=556287 RepID=A0A3R7NJ26_9HYPH|nr:hypothetical protein C0030_003590 [Candidatus Liberibacter solanacearum]
MNLLKRSQLPDGGYGAFARLWKEESPDSYAGLHNSVALLPVFDEASGIPSIIFKTAEGFFTEDIVNRMWLVFTNPRRRSGPFFDIFDKDYPDWNKRHISGFDVEGIDHQVYHNWIRQYGEESNVVRHDVYGQFPLQDTDQFFSAEGVKKAEEREPYFDDDEPLVMGIDVEEEVRIQPLPYSAVA